MERVIVGFSKPKTWKPYAWLIMKSFGTPYSHTYIKVYSNTYKRYLIYQASGTSVNFMSDQIFNDHAIVVDEFMLEISDEARKSMMQFAIDNCGKPYGMKEALGLAIVKIASWMGKTIKNPLSDKEATYVCSGLVAEVLRDFFGKELPKDPDDMTPKDVYELLVNSK